MEAPRRGSSRDRFDEAAQLAFFDNYENSFVGSPRLQRDYFTFMGWFYPIVAA